MSDKVVVKSNGIGFLGLLGIVFIVLKLCGVINWSWWLVTLPLWGGLVLAVGIFLLALLFAIVFAVVSKK